MKKRVKAKLLHELNELFWVSLYFLCWFGALMLIKLLLLHEYKLEFYGASIVFVGALVAAKAVILLKRVPLLKNQPAWLDVVLRTLLYLAGVFVLLVLEKGFEARHEYGGFFAALKNTFKDSNDYHIWINTLCVFGTLFFFNFGEVIKLHLGVDSFLKLLRKPLPKKTESHK
jgi:hypothetical protein